MHRLLLYSWRRGDCLHFFFSSRRRHTRWPRDWSSDVCSSDLAAIVMVAAFSGFVAGRVVGLQQFGIGLAVAIFVDATIVRALLVPALMAWFGRWNWWLPARVARIVRVKPSPLAEPAG